VFALDLDVWLGHRPGAARLARSSWELIARFGCCEVGLGDRVRVKLYIIRKFIYVGKFTSRKGLLRVILQSAISSLPILDEILSTLVHSTLA
jgi:hypothetical protein